MTLTRTCLAVGVALCLAPAALAGSAELAWIGEIPGLKADLTKSGQTSQGIYTVTGDPAAVFDKLQQGFVRNGWTIEKFTNVGMVGIRTIVAVKEGTRAKAVLAAGESLIVNFTPAADGAERSRSTSTDTINVIKPAPAARTAPAAKPAPAAKAAPAVSAARPAGPRLEINQSQTTGAWACEGTDVVVRGTGSEITLEGNCGEIAVHGIGNRIEVRGRVFTIEAHGRDNVVNWSAAANSSAPRQKVFGHGNQVNKVE
jgi:hypothetical protein